MSGSIQLKTPGADLLYTFDWTADLPPEVSLDSVEHTVPPPLERVSQQTDAANGLSTVMIGGGEHGKLYLITALATLTDGEEVPGSFTLRVSASS